MEKFWWFETFFGMILYSTVKILPLQILFSKNSMVIVLRIRDIIKFLWGFTSCSLIISNNYLSYFLRLFSGFFATWKSIDILKDSEVLTYMVSVEYSVVERYFVWVFVSRRVLVAVIVVGAAVTVTVTGGINIVIVLLDNFGFSITSTTFGSSEEIEASSHKLDH